MMFSRISTFILTLSIDLQPLATHFPSVISFYGTRDAIVDQSAASMNIDGGKEVPVDAKHETLCHFDGLDDRTFIRVCEGLAAAGLPDNHPTTEAPSGDNMPGSSPDTKNGDSPANFCGPYRIQICSNHVHPMDSRLREGHQDYGSVCSARQSLYKLFLEEQSRGLTAGAPSRTSTT